MMTLRRDDLNDDDQGWDAFIEHKRESRNPWATKKEIKEDDDQPLH